MAIARSDMNPPRMILNIAHSNNKFSCGAFNIEYVTNKYSRSIFNIEQINNKYPRMRIYIA